MKFGVREICDVVLKKKAPGWFGKIWLDAGMPVLYFDTLKTSTLEGAATTVYAQGGKGNPRLVAWEGDRTVTFTMEDALISPQSFSVLSGAGLMLLLRSRFLFMLPSRLLLALMVRLFLRTFLLLLLIVTMLSPLSW